MVVWFCVLFLGFSMVFFVNTILGTTWVVELEMVGVHYSAFYYTIIFDFFSFFFSFVVFVVSGMIYFFSFYYMHSEKMNKVFSKVLFFFVASMMLLVFSPNLFSLLLGWDGLGVVSYLLVVFYMNPSSANAGMVTFLMNRVGDVFFLYSISYFMFFGVWSFMEIKSMNFGLSIIMVVALITKSAQIPFSSWLPAAMAAPTPVSSLVHSSTLVTAGVFLMIRFFSVVVLSCWLLFVLSIFTMLMAGFSALKEWDMKKIIAFSTLSQLGFMVVSLSVGLIFFCFFHLLCHAFFKASLFLCSGVVIHSSDNSQDFRNLTAVAANKAMSANIVVCLLCLMGFPYLSGFFSKDIILDGSFFSFFFFFFFFFSVMLTVSYSVRFCYSILSLLKIRFMLIKIYEKVYYIILPIFFLSLCGIFFGVFVFEVFLIVSVVLVFSVCWKLVYFSFYIILIFFLILCLSSNFVLKSYWQFFFGKIWFLSVLSKYKNNFIFLLGGIWLSKCEDMGWFEKKGPQGAYTIFLFLGSGMSRDQSFYFFFAFFILFFSVFMV